MDYGANFIHREIEDAEDNRVEEPAGWESIRGDFAELRREAFRSGGLVKNIHGTVYASS
jgi:hypothetical protein